MTVHLLCATPLLPAIASRAQAEFNAVTMQERQLTTAETIAALAAHPTMAAVLVSSRIRFDADAIAMLPPHVRLIATCSVGHEHIDLAAARARGIVVTNTPDVVTEATADLALFLMLGALRRGREYAAIMEQGWRQRYGLGDMLGLDFHGKTLGIVGMGRIGQAVARRARGFGVRVLYHNRRQLAPDREHGAEYCPDLHAMLPRCQIVSLHIPGGGGFDRYFDAPSRTAICACATCPTSFSRRTWAPPPWKPAPPWAIARSTMWPIFCKDAHRATRFSRRQADGWRHHAVTSSDELECRVI